MPNPTYRQVLVGTDGSETSFRAVDRAADIARSTGATLLVATAYRPLSAREQKIASDELGHNSYKVTGSTPAEEVLRSAVERASMADVEIETVAVQGEPVDVLVTLAQERGVDLIVVGNRGMHSITGRLLGSVPSVAAHRTPCDILIVATT